jgi:hypothetical protein
MLIKVLEAKSETQAIVISPHSLSSVTATDKIKKIVIRPVDRGQRALAFAPASHPEDGHADD